MFNFKIFSPNSKVRFLTVVFIILISQLIILFLHFSELNYSIKEVATECIHGDAISFSKPLDNFYKTGSYSPDYRSPGLAVPYLIFLFITGDYDLAKFLFLISQALFFSITIAILIYFFKKIFFNDLLLLITCLTFVLFPLSYLTYFSFYSEKTSLFAISVSLLMISLYYNTKKKYYIILASLFLTWSWFCRPVHFILFPIFSFIFILNEYKKENKKLVSLLKILASFVILPTIIQLSWVTRNYFYHQKINFFVNTNNTFGYYPLEDKDSILYDLYSFILSWGGNILYWEPGSAIRWFEIKKKGTENLNDRFDKINPFPSNIFTSQFNKDSLIQFRNDVIFFNNLDREDSMRPMYSVLIKNKINKYITQLKSEKPYVYYIQSRLLCLKRFIFESRTGIYNFDKKTINNIKVALLLKASSLSYLIILGLIAPLILLIIIFKQLTLNKFNEQIGIFSFLSFTGFSLFIIYPLIKTSEGRYFFVCYPFLNLVLLEYFFDIINKFKIAILKKIK